MKLFIKINGVFILIIGVALLLPAFFGIVAHWQSIGDKGFLMVYIKENYVSVTSLLLFLILGLYSVIQGYGLMANRKFGYNLTIFMPVAYLLFLLCWNGSWDIRIYYFVLYAVILFCVFLTSPIKRYFRTEFRGHNT
ncbi:MAG TPA: hypothetical protein PL155_04975 [Candidatus Omnitrophota bacterium]|nr:hypothetical protein [Candidatus Omnitrophota bacterium]HPD84168.1 hypothetical protein [Candidatus Omnitrophota bacterium]HRZ03025.1 hypothetical protein [Candidatus Omnitrophota bacterium]